MASEQRYIFGWELPYRFGADLMHTSPAECQPLNCAALECAGIACYTQGVPFYRHNWDKVKAVRLRPQLEKRSVQDKRLCTQPTAPVSGQPCLLVVMVVKAAWTKQSTSLLAVAFASRGMLQHGRNNKNNETSVASKTRCYNSIHLAHL